MRCLSFVVVGHPEPAGSKKALQSSYQQRPFVVDSNPKSKGWKRIVAATARGAMLREKWETVSDPIRVTMVFDVLRPKGHFKANGELSSEGLRNPHPAKRPDVLKLARGVEDAMTEAGVYTDDALIVDERLIKRWGSEEGVAITVTSLEPDDEAGVEFRGFRILPNHKICYLLDLPHDDPQGCPTCGAKRSSDGEMCIHAGKSWA